MQFGASTVVEVNPLPSPADRRVYRRPKSDEQASCAPRDIPRSYDSEALRFGTSLADIEATVRFVVQSIYNSVYMLYK